MAKSTRKSTPANDVTIMTPEDFGSDEQEQDAPVAQQASSDDTPMTEGSLARVLQTIVDGSPVKRVPFAKYKPISSFNPTGSKKRKLTRRCYQNGTPMDINVLHDEEISLLNQIKPGKYINNIVTVVVAQNGDNVDQHLIYKNQTVDQRMANANAFRSLTDMLQQIVSEGRDRGVIV